ncbi:unnamed protein product, partial [Amoebophrya sp. A120]
PSTNVRNFRELHPIVPIRVPLHLYHIHFTSADGGAAKTMKSSPLACFFTLILSPRSSTGAASSSGSGTTPAPPHQPRHTTPATVNHQRNSTAGGSSSSNHRQPVLPPLEESSSSLLQVSGCTGDDGDLDGQFPGRRSILQNDGESRQPGRGGSAGRRSFGLSGAENNYEDDSEDDERDFTSGENRTAGNPNVMTYGGAPSPVQPNRGTTAEPKKCKKRPVVPVDRLYLAPDDVFTPVTPGTNLRANTKPGSGPNSPPNTTTDQQGTTSPKAKAVPYVTDPYTDDPRGPWARAMNNKTPGVSNFHRHRGIPAPKLGPFGLAPGQQAQVDILNNYNNPNHLQPSTRRPGSPRRDGSKQSHVGDMTPFT